MLTDSAFFPTLVQLTVNFGVYVFLILSVFRGNLRYRTRTNVLLVGGYVLGSLVLLMLCALYSSPYSQYSTPAVMLWIAGTVAIGLVILQAGLLQFLFLIFVVLCFQHNIINTAGLLYKVGLLGRLFSSSSLRMVALNTLVLLVALPVMCYLLLNLFRRLLGTHLDPAYWRHLFVIPASIYLYCIFNSIYYGYGGKNQIAPMVALLMTLLMTVFSVLAFAVVLKMLLKTSDSLQATEKAAVSERQLRIQNEQYEKLAEQVSQSERARHDLRHHFAALKGYMEDGNIAAAERYLDDCIGATALQEAAPVCERHAVDMLLRHYIAKARALGAEVRTDIHLPEAFGLPDIDLCALFGNLVENAVESCARQTAGKKFVTIKVTLIGRDMLAITVANSYDGEIQQNTEGFLSGKHGGVGIGTASVRTIAEKNGGTCKFERADHVFKVSVLLVA